jgi:hypothetical protein
MLTYVGQAQAHQESLNLAATCRHNLDLQRSSLPSNVVLEVDLPSPGPDTLSAAELFDELRAEHPGRFVLGQTRSIEQQVKRWQIEAAARGIVIGKRTYRGPKSPRTWRTRIDPFAPVWPGGARTRIRVSRFGPGAFAKRSVRGGVAAPRIHEERK